MFFRGNGNRTVVLSRVGLVARSLFFFFNRPSVNEENQIAALPDSRVCMKNINAYWTNESSRSHHDQSSLNGGVQVHVSFDVFVFFF